MSSSDGTGVTSADRLESWKEIAAFLGRGVTTVQRWEEEEGLPVHRHVHARRGTVHAFRSELAAWRNRREAVAPVPAPDSPPPREPVRPALVAGVVFITALVVGLVLRRVMTSSDRG